MSSLSDKMGSKKRGWKKLVTDRARAILYAAVFRQPIEGDDDAFLRDLIALHSEAEQKIGSGIAHFEVRPNEWKSRTFWIVRCDGTETDFSFLKAITPPSPMQDFAKACRTAVVEQILDFKATSFAGVPVIVCPITGERVTRETAHVDHAEPWTFAALVEDFAKDRDITDDVEQTHDGDLRTYFRDKSLANLFADFHRERASLRIVSRTANLSILRKTK